MKIFLSHSSRQKPLVREIRKFFPKHINTWIDEQKLLIGDDISNALQTEVSEQSDYILLFLDNAAAKSQWVKKEIHWALEAERDLGRSILLIVLIDQEALNVLEIPALESRRYIECKDFSEKAVEYTANNIVGNLFALTCRDLERVNNPTTENKIDIIKNADDYLDGISRNIISLLFPYRKENPILLSEFYQIFDSSTEDNVSLDSFTEILDELFDKGRLPGVSFDGHDLFILEEHYKWKTQVNREHKAKVARVAAREVRSGDIIAVDAGSATDEVIKVLCVKFKSKSLSRVTIVTNSLSAVEMLLTMADINGMDEHSCPFRIFLVDGFVRPNTRAIVNNEDDDEGSFLKTLRKLGGADIGLVGVNGIDVSAGLTTHENVEVKNKRDIISSSRKTYILGDSSKIGIVERCQFSNFQNDVSLIINSSPESAKLCDALSGQVANIIVAT